MQQRMLQDAIEGEQAGAFRQEESGAVRSDVERLPKRHIAPSMTERVRPS